MIAFFDACALIYLVEGSEPFSAKVRRELAAAAARHPELAAAVVASLPTRPRFIGSRSPALCRGVGRIEHQRNDPGGLVRHSAGLAFER